MKVHLLMNSVKCGFSNGVIVTKTLESDRFEKQSTFHRLRFIFLFDQINKNGKWMSKKVESGWLQTNSYMLICN